MTDATLFDERVCDLGEGPLWHPARGQLFWFDIYGRKLLSRDGDTRLDWQFDEYVSAAGWVDRDTLLIASATGLYRFSLADGTSTLVHPLEADNPVTRSNDGRADPQGGFWIGTMGEQAEPGAGAIYRFYKGELRELYPSITVSNSICFTPDGTHAYYTDTLTHRIMRQLLDAEGWPDGPPELFVDLGPDKLNPDGSVVDSQGGLWNAQWGAARVARYLPDGRFDRAINVPATNSSCPAFGGEDLKTLYITSARTGLKSPNGSQGQLFHVRTEIPGQFEHRVTL